MNKEVTKKELKEKMIQNRLTIVQFKSTWSGACQIIFPVYEELAILYKQDADFFSIDVEEEKDIEKDFGISELPTIIFFKGDQIVDHAVGLVPKNTLITKIENALASFGYTLNNSITKKRYSYD